MSTMSTEYEKNYYKRNKNRLSVLAKKRYAKNKIEILEKTRIYRNTNKEKIKQREKNRYINNCKMLDNLKINGCSICGYNKCNSSLDFHHVNPEDKHFPTSSLTIRRKTEDIVNELNKCILLCKNCHYEIHYLKNNR